MKRVKDQQEIMISFQGSIEEKIYQRQIIKQGLSGAVADSLSTGKTEFSTKDLKVIKLAYLPANNYWLKLSKEN